MSEDGEYLTCSCNHCEQHLEFPAEGVGTEIQCPTCGMAVVLTKAKLKNKFQIPKPKNFVPRDDPGLPKCRVCGKDVSPSADICPHCGEREPGATVQCRYCGSKKVTVSNAQVLSYGKAAAATVLLGPIGLLAGFLPANHIFYRCLDCGKSF